MFPFVSEASTLVGSLASNTPILDSKSASIPSALSFSAVIFPSKDSTASSNLPSE
jgi:hypothetical protein